MNRKADIAKLLPLAAALFLACGQKPASVELQPKNVDLGKKGESKSLVATVKDKDGKPIADVPVTWSTSDAKIATVDGGKVTAVSTGRATITAKAAEVQGSASASVLIPSKIAIEPTEVTLRGAGQNQELTLTVSDDKNMPIPGAKVEWSSDHPEIATAKEVTVTAVADGMATLTAKAGAATTSVQVHVKGPVAAKINLDPAQVVVKAGGSQQLNAAILDDANAPMTGVTITWASADPAVATVDDKGLVTGVKRGDITVTATAGAVTAEAPVRVR